MSIFTLIRYQQFQNQIELFQMNTNLDQIPKIIINNQFLQKELTSDCNQLDAAEISEQNPSLGMREVLINSMRINKRLHGEIVAKQYQVKNEAQQVNIRLQSLYRDMHDIYNKTQQLYQEIVRQNKKTRFMAEELMRPFYQELKGKVDQTTLSLRMKMMLSDFDNIGHKISYDKNGRAQSNNQNHTFHFVKTQLFPLITNIENQIHEKVIIAQTQAESIQILTSKQDYLQKGLSQQKQEFIKMRQDLMSQINIKMNEDVLNHRINQLYTQLVSKNINGINHTISHNRKEVFTELEILKNEVSALMSKNYEEKISDNFKKMEEIKREVLSINQNHFNESIKELRRNIEQNKTVLQKQISNKTFDRKNDQKIILLAQQNKEIKGLIERISEKLSMEVEKTFNNFDKGLVYKVAKIDTEIKVIHQNIKSTQKILQSEQLQIGFIKDLLSKKANFSDFIVHIENKANRQDYKELKNLIESNTHSNFNNNTHFEQIQQDSCMITQQEPKDQQTPSRFRKRQSTSGRKNYQQSTSPFVQSQRDQSVKRYMLGLKNGASNYTRQKLLKQKAKFVFLNQNQRKKPKNSSKAQTFTQTFI